jgi:hypothetical protein
VPRIAELYELARLYYVQTNATLDPEVKKTLQDRGDQHLKEADELRRRRIIQAVFPKN